MSYRVQMNGLYILKPSPRTKQAQRSHDICASPSIALFPVDANKGQTLAVSNRGAGYESAVCPLS